MTAAQYVESRGLPAATVNEWHLRIGVQERWPKLDDRLVIPIYSYTGRAITESGRALSPEQKPKYWFTPGFLRDRWVYGLWRERISIPVVVEGYLDVWAARLLGYSAYAVMGGSLSDWQAMHIAGMGATAIIYPHADDDGTAWQRKLALFGVRTEIPLSPYPLGVPRKADGDDETADPHWLYVNSRSWLEKNLQICKHKLEPRSLGSYFNGG